MSIDLLHRHDTGVKVRSTTQGDISKIIDLQKQSFSISCSLWKYMAPRRVTKSSSHISARSICCC